MTTNTLELALDFLAVIGCVPDEDVLSFLDHHTIFAASAVPFRARPVCSLI